ncbi:hypothetical protein LJC68_08955 [Bacteroidales bacterium OttesenSCG-928-B11]|nr:hypothetical protein [Bacteroidales bacterium OttesenSCG-928-B11]
MKQKPLPITPKKRLTIDELRENDFEAVSLYYSTGNSESLSEKQKEILDRLRTAHAILRKYPRKSVAALKLQARYPHISKEQAFVDIRNACKFWNKYDSVDRDFLEGWFLDWLMKEIADPATSDTARAKNIATLQKFLAQLPPVKIDPKLMESNQIFIQFNFKDREFCMPENLLQRLPADVRSQLMGNLRDEIGEDTAFEILNS